MPAGLVAGYSRTLLDPLIMRGVDVVLSFPALLIMLLAVTAFGNGPVVLVGSAALVLFPGVARIVRTATAEVATRAYVEAAMARGERPGRGRAPGDPAEHRPAARGRPGHPVQLVDHPHRQRELPRPGHCARRPPTGALMVSENRSIFATNPLAVLAPAAMLALLIIGVNLVGDAYVRRLGRSRGRP